MSDVFFIEAMVRAGIPISDEAKEVLANAKANAETLTLDDLPPNSKVEIRRRKRDSVMEAEIGIDDYHTAEGRHTGGKDAMQAYLDRHGIDWEYCIRRHTGSLSGMSPDGFFRFAFPEDRPRLFVRVRSWHGWETEPFDFWKPRGWVGVYHRGENERKGSAPAGYIPKRPTPDQMRGIEVVERGGSGKGLDRRDATC